MAGAANAPPNPASTARRPMAFLGLFTFVSSLIEAEAGCQRAVASSTAPCDTLVFTDEGSCGEAKTEIPQRTPDDATSRRCRRDPGAGGAYRRQPKPLADDLREPGQA